MSDIQWIKITTGIFDDEKITLIEQLPDGDTILVIWLKLLVLAGKKNDSGLIYITRDIPYNDERLSAILKRPIPIVRLALATFTQFGMIEIVNDIIAVCNWEKHQNVDGLEKIREQNRLRVAKHREKQKLLLEGTDSNVTSNVTVTNQSNVSETESNALEKNKNRIDKEKELFADPPPEAPANPKKSARKKATTEKAPELYFNGKYKWQELVDIYTEGIYAVGELEMVWQKNQFVPLKKLVAVLEKIDPDFVCALDAVVENARYDWRYYDKKEERWKMAPTPLNLWKNINDLLPK